MLLANDRSLSARLRLLPGQFLLALVNATTILVIVAAVLTIIAISKAENAATNISAAMTEAVLSRLGTEPKQLLSRVESVQADIRELSEALKTINVGNNTILAPQIDSLKARLAETRVSIKGLVEARTALINQAVSEVRTAIIDGLATLRPCSAPSANNAGVGDST